MEYSVIKIAPEYGTWPLWDGVTGAPIDHCDLLISEDLKQRISEWDEVFQSTLNDHYPPDSNFPSEANRLSYIEEGALLTNVLKEQLPNTSFILVIPE